MYAVEHILKTKSNQELSANNHRVEQSAKAMASTVENNINFHCSNEWKYSFRNGCHRQYYAIQDKTDSNHITLHCDETTKTANILVTSPVSRDMAQQALLKVITYLGVHSSDIEMQDRYIKVLWEALLYLRDGLQKDEVKSEELESSIYSDHSDLNRCPVHDNKEGIELMEHGDMHRLDEQFDHNKDMMGNNDEVKETQPFGLQIIKPLDDDQEDSSGIPHQIYQVYCPSEFESEHENLENDSYSERYEDFCDDAKSTGSVDHMDKNTRGKDHVINIDDSSNSCGGDSEEDNDRRKYSCDLCCEVFSGSVLLFNHKLTEHRHGNSNKRHVQSNDKSSVYRKKKYKHMDEEELLCRTCHLIFVDRVKFHEHVASHLDEVIYKCPLCAEFFQSSFGLKVHIDSHT